MSKILQLLDITALDHWSCTNTVHRSLVINVPRSITKLDWHLGLFISIWRPSQSLALLMIRNIHLMSSLNYKTSFSHVIALYKILLSSWHLFPTSSVTGTHASSVLIVVGKMSLSTPSSQAALVLADLLCVPPAWNSPWEPDPRTAHNLQWRSSHSLVQWSNIADEIFEEHFCPFFNLSLFINCPWLWSWIVISVILFEEDAVYV